MSKIQATFERLQSQGRRALITFLMPGDPGPELTVSLMHALAEGGSDIIELALPFSGLIADVPSIQRASDRALARHVDLRKVLGMVAEFRADNNETPVVLMTCVRALRAFGVDEFAAAAFDAGVDGVLSVDDKPEDVADFSRTMKNNSLDPVFQLTVDSTPEHIEQLGELSSTYIYFKPPRGADGTAVLDLPRITSQVSQIRALVGMPVAVAGSVRTIVTAAAVARIADAVVVGSRVVEEVEQSTPETVLERLKALVVELRRSIDAVV